MKKKIFVLLIFFCSTVLFSQKNQYEKYFKEGNDYLLDQNYNSALDFFLKAYQFDSTNANINFKIGYCYSEIPGKKHLGEKYFIKAIVDVSEKYDENNPSFKKAPYYVFFYYGELLHVTNRLEEAKKMFKLYEAYVNKASAKEDFELLMHYEKMVEYAEERELYPVRLTIKNLGDSINTPYSEYAPVCDGDEKTLIFTYKGIRSIGADEGLLTEDGRFYEDIFVSYKRNDGSWSKASPIRSNINSKAHEASVSLSYDGNTLIVYRANDEDGNLYYTEKNGDNWGELKKFSSEINSKYWEPSACFSTDKSILFFVSDRPGGLGGRDIYKTKKLPNGEWSKPVNLGPKINTIYDEESPFLHSNGKDLYFSSNGHKSMGGFDIMISEMNENGEFGEIYPLPYPINTTEDDLFYFVSGDGKRAYYSSLHSDSMSKGENDIYVVSIEELNRKDRVFARGGFLLQENETPKDSLMVIITKKESGAIVGKFIPNKNGEFITQLSSDSVYEVSYFQNNTSIKKEIVNFENKKSIGRFGYEIILDKVAVLDRDKIVSNPTKDNVDKGSSEEKTYNTKDETAGNFIHYFEYNKISALNNVNLPRFVAELEAKVRKEPGLNIQITSSASRVPTKMKGGNVKLANLRLEDMKTLIIEQLTQKGINTSNIKFISSSSVSGPAYKNDAVENRRIYEKFQYVKVQF